MQKFENLITNRFANNKEFKPYTYDQIYSVGVMLEMLNYEVTERILNSLNETFTYIIFKKDDKIQFFLKFQNENVFLVGRVINIIEKLSILPDEVYENSEFDLQKILKIILMII